MWLFVFFFFFQAEDGIRDLTVTGVQTCALPISASGGRDRRGSGTRAPGRARRRGAAAARAALGGGSPGAAYRADRARGAPRSAAGPPRHPARAHAGDLSRRRRTQRAARSGEGRRADRPPARAVGARLVPGAAATLRLFRRPVQRARGGAAAERARRALRAGGQPLTSRPRVVVRLG